VLTASGGDPVAPRDRWDGPRAGNDVDNSQRFRSTPVTIDRHLTGTRLGYQYFGRSWIRAARFETCSGGDPNRTSFELHL